MKRTHNPLSAWIVEFIAHQPQARPHEAWQQLVATATDFPRVLHWLNGYDPQSRAVIYQRSLYNTAQYLGQTSFKRQFQRLRQVAEMSPGFVPRMTKSLHSH